MQNSTNQSQMITNAQKNHRMKNDNEKKCKMTNNNNDKKKKSV